MEQRWRDKKVSSLGSLQVVHHKKRKFSRSHCTKRGTKRFSFTGKTRRLSDSRENISPMFLKVLLLLLSVHRELEWDTYSSSLVHHKKLSLPCKFSRSRYVVCWNEEIWCGGCYTQHNTALVALLTAMIARDDFLAVMWILGSKFTTNSCCGFAYRLPWESGRALRSLLNLALDLQRW